MKLTKLGLVLGVLLLTACGQPSHTPYSPGSTPPADGGLGEQPDPNEPATFVSVKTQLLDQHCTGCHAPGGRLMDLSTYEAVTAGGGLVVPGQPEQSRLYTVIQSGVMPPRGTVPPETLALLAKWITEGSQKN